MLYQQLSDSIKTKKLDDMSALELAFVHINGRKVNEIYGGFLLSVIPVVLREIGHAKENFNSKNFLPISAAFTVLDQLGFCYSRTDMEVCKKNNGTNEANGIKKSLYYFCGFDENSEDGNALVGLRNSFLHTASGISKALYDGQANYCFSIDKNINVLVKHSSESWDGDFQSLDEDNFTYVNPDKIFELVDCALSEVLNCLYEDTLRVSCGKKELYFRFIKFVNNPEG